MQASAFIFEILGSGDGVTTIVDLISHGGVPALLIVILYGGFKEKPWWVFGNTYRDLQTRYDERGKALDKWWETARKATSVSEILAQIQKEETEKKKGELQ
jgi:hypothetical protein